MSDDIIGTLVSAGLAGLDADGDFRLLNSFTGPRFNFLLQFEERLYTRCSKDWVVIGA